MCSLHRLGRFCHHRYALDWSSCHIDNLAAHFKPYEFKFTFSIIWLVASSHHDTRKTDSIYKKSQPHSVHINYGDDDCGHVRARGHDDAQPSVQEQERLSQDNRVLQ